MLNDSDAQWWRSAVIYQIYPKSWADGNGDGYGDVAGIRSRLGYLADLGVDAIWFSPWYLSPQLDGGYDVADYRDIDPLFGTVEEVERLIEEAHRLGIRIIVDVVPNHTSWEHRFFKEAQAAGPGSEAWKRYHIVPGAQEGTAPPNDWRCVFGGSAWSPMLVDGEPSGYWYLHLFDSSQPDVNWDHPDIHAEFVDTLRFWFDRGVDGFRIDVAHGLVKAPGYPASGETDENKTEILDGDIKDLPQWEQEGVHEIWREWRAVADEYQPPRAFVGEVWVATPERHAAYLRPDELHTAFNFHYLTTEWDATKLRGIIDASLHASGLVGAPTTWVLENHDVPRVRSRLGMEAVGEPINSMPLKSGVEPDLEAGLRRARAALVFMLGLPGSAYIYQGQELGLPEVYHLPAEVREDPAFHRTAGEEGFRDGCRVPIPWAPGGTSLGFGPDGGAAPWLPIPAEWADLSVESQTGDPASMLTLTTKALAQRKQLPGLAGEDYEWLDSPHESLLLLKRGEGEAAALVALNLGEEPIDLGELDLGFSDVVLTSGNASEDSLELPGETAVWLR